jgi:hypothetical protein
VEFVFNDENDPRLTSLFSALIHNTAAILRDRTLAANKRNQETVLKLVANSTAFTLPVKAWKNTIVDAFEREDVRREKERMKTLLNCSISFPFSPFIVLWFKSIWC